MPLSYRCALVLLSPGREWSLTELAERAGGSVSSAQREMARAEEATAATAASGGDLSGAYQLTTSTTL